MKMILPELLYNKKKQKKMEWKDLPLGEWDKINYSTFM